MSQTRTAISIQSVPAQAAREPLFNVADVLSGLWRGAAFVARGMATTAHALGQEYAEAAMASRATAQAVLRPVATDEIAEKILLADNLQDGFAILAATPLLLTAAQREITRAQLVTLSRQAAALGVAQIAGLARELGSSHQQTLVAHALAMVREVCEEAGFKHIKARPADGYVLAQQADVVGGPVVRIDVRPATHGEVGLHMDADRFQGTACRQPLESLEAGFRARGMRFEPMRVRFKTRRPVLDGLRAPLVTRLGFPRG